MHPYYILRSSIPQSRYTGSQAVRQSSSQVGSLDCTNMFVSPAGNINALEVKNLGPRCSTRCPGCPITNANSANECDDLMARRSPAITIIYAVIGSVDRDQSFHHPSDSEKSGSLPWQFECFGCRRQSRTIDIVLYLKDDTMVSKPIQYLAWSGASTRLIAANFLGADPEEWIREVSLRAGYDE